MSLEVRENNTGARNLYEKVWFCSGGSPQKLL